METSKLKIGSFAGVAAVFAVLLGYFMGQFLKTGDAAQGIFASAAGALFLALFVLQTVAVRNKTWLAALSLAQSLAIIIAYGPGSLLAIGAGAALAVLLALAAFRGGGASGEQISAGVSKIALMTLPLAITGLSIFIAAHYVGAFSGRDFQVTKASIESSLKPGAFLVRGFIPGFSPEMTVGDFVKSAATGKISGLLGAVPQEFRSQIETQVSSQVLDELVGGLSEQLGVAISKGDSLSEVAQRAINSKLRKIPETSRTPILFGFGLLVFLTVKGLGSLYTYAVRLIAWLLYKLLLAVGFFKIVTESVNRETLIV